MDRVIPKDVVDLIYKESHHNNTKRLMEEYHKLFLLDGDDILVKYRFNVFYFNYRPLTNGGFGMSDIFSFRNKKLVNVCCLPKKYLYSSGHSELKWIE